MQGRPIMDLQTVPWKEYVSREDVMDSLVSSCHTLSTSMYSVEPQWSNSDINTLELPIIP